MGKRKTGRVRNRQRDSLCKWLADKGIDMKSSAGPTVIAEAVECELGIDMSALNAKTRISQLFHRLFKTKAPTPPRKAASQDKIKAFYQSYDWRKLRFQVLTEDGEKCVLCNRTAKNGAVMHVDHIKPLRYNWALRLSRSNLQVLCDACNHGKGNIEWRAHG